MLYVDSFFEALFVEVGVVHAHSLVALFGELLFRRLSRLHPGVDLADFELPQPANLDGGHTALFDPGQASIAGNAEVLAYLVHRVPTFQFFVYHIHINPHSYGWV
jgi:hypothetical protein